MEKKQLLKDSLTVIVLLASPAASIALAESLTFQLLHQKNGADISEELGISVAGIGDVNNDGYSDFIIGAHLADPNGLVDAGSVYIYSGQTGSLLFQKNGSAPGDQFGWDVAGTGDVNGDGRKDFIIGAPSADVDTLNAAGSAYVYSGLDGNLLFQKNGSTNRDYFGFAVAGAGDVNADGKADFIVGTPYADPGGLNRAGSAYLHSGADGGLLYQKDGMEVGDEFGASVAGIGDINGDGKADFIIGARFATLGGVDSAGSAFVYSGANGNLVYRKDGSSLNEWLGYSVAGAGDVDGDGNADFIVGAPGKKVGGFPFAGSSFIYSGFDGQLLFQKNGDVTSEELGFSVSGAGDVNGDGRDDFLIGAVGASPDSFRFAGSALIYSGVDGSLLFRKNGASEGESLGNTVAGLGDVNGDGRDDFIIGAIWADPNGFTDAGSAFVYGLVSTDVAEEKTNRPGQFELSQNYPNPFNPTTTIRYFLPKRGKVALEIFNLLGERVRMLLEKEQTAGEHTAVWDGKDENRRILSSGIYFYRLKGENFSETKKMIFLK